jgi:hypothetical protein
MHIPEVDACSRYLYRSQDNGTRPDGIDVHMPIGSEFQLFRRDGVFMRSTYQR